MANILVTGADGFIGANFIRYLLEGKWVPADCNIFALMRRTKPEILSPLALSGVADKVIPFFCDLRDFATLKDMILRYEIECIYHFAAQPIVKIAEKDPANTMNTNVIGTLNLLEASRLAGVKGFYLMSSDKVYGDEAPPYKEDTPIGKNANIYDASKACAEVITMSYGKTYGIETKIGRSCNIFGPLDLNFSRIIPDVIREILTTGKYKVFEPTNHNMVREFIYIDDLCKAVHLVATCGKEQIYNIASGDGGFSITEVKDLIAKTLGEGEPEYVEDTRTFTEIENQYLDDSKIRIELSFDNDYDFEAGLRVSADWYKEYIAMRWQ